MSVQKNASVKTQFSKRGAPLFFGAITIALSAAFGTLLFIQSPRNIAPAYKFYTVKVPQWPSK